MSIPSSYEKMNRLVSKSVCDLARTQRYSLLTMFRETRYSHLTWFL